MAPGSALGAGWLPISPAPPASGGTIATPKVAVDDAGDVFAVWIEGGRLEVAKRPVGGAFETPQTLDPAPASTTASHPGIGVDGAGNAVAVWTEVDSAGAHVIKEARRAAGAASFGAPTTVPNATTILQGIDNPRIAINRAGEAVLAVTGNFNTDGFVRTYIATSTADFIASAATSHDYQITGSPTIFPPDVAIDEAGDAVVVWRANAGSNLMVNGGYRVHGAQFGALESVSAGATTGKNDPAVAIDSLGNAVAVYNEDPSTGGQTRAYERSAGAPAGSAWTKLNDFFPQVAFDGTNSAVAAWSENGELRASTLPAGSGMQFGQPPLTLAASPEDPFAISFDAGAGGTAALVWSSSGASNSTVRAAARPNAGPFGPISTLSIAGHNGDQTDVAVDPNGNAAAVWVDFNPADKSTRLVTNEYDATPPGLLATVPSTASTGAPVAMSANATDDWSVPAVTWAFGDGQSGTGSAVSHTYASAGTYTVTTAASDAAGNVSTSTSTIKVAAVAPPVPPPKEGKSFNASKVSGTVFVSVPKGKATGGLLKRAVVHGAAGPVISAPHGYTGFRHLGKNDNVPVGSILDATRGVSQIRMATNHAGTKFQKGTFSQGAFLIKQTTHSPLTSAEMLGGGNFTRDCKAGGAKVLAGAARRRPHRQLFAHVKGRFRTRGRHSTATVRGTKYLVKDTCAGTLTRVTQGRVVVRDFRLHKTVIVKTGHQYLARV
jgi:hypothetical protein